MKRGPKFVACIGLLLCAGMSVLPTSAEASGPPLLWQAPKDGISDVGAGGVANPWGVAVDPVDGHVFVSDVEASRISEFTAWGEFVMAFGWGVRTGAAALQSCDSQTGCQTGLRGSATGQLAFPEGIAVDSSGDVYVFDGENHRVQKFGPEGEFLWMAGGDVDQTTGGNLCTGASGHTCGIGVPGEGPGEFKNETAGNYIALGPEGHLYVGDVGRIEEFSAEGAVEGEVAIPGETVRALAIDAAGNFYVGYAKNVIQSKRGVHKLSTVGIEIASFPADSPEALAVASSGELYVDENPTFPDESLKNGSGYEPRIAEFSAAGTRLLPSEEDDAKCQEIRENHGNCEYFGEASPRGELRGIAVSNVCGQAGVDIYVGRQNTNEGNLRAYGPAPDPNICEPSSGPPQVASQFAVSANSEAAILKARINPQRTTDTTYYVEYGVGKCSEGGCAARQPAVAVALTSEPLNVPVLTKGVVLSGLSPATTYHFRFVAQNGRGGPVFGVAPEGGEADSAEGLEGSFTTPALPPSETGFCPNAQFRTGFSADLPDCRAYELVTPVDKNNGDILALFNLTNDKAELDQGTPGGEALTYSAYRAFAEPQSAPIMSQYLARRGAGGWANQAISPARGVSLLGTASFDTEFRAFTSNLCSGWILHDTDPILAPGAVEGFANIYRTDLCEGAESHEAVTTSSPPGHVGNAREYQPDLQGTSADGALAAFRVNDRLQVAGGPAPAAGSEYQCYQSVAGQLRLISVLPGAVANQTSCSIGTANATVEVRRASVEHAVSEDGSRIYWTGSSAELFGPGPIYLRLNGLQPESARSLGAGAGSGQLIGPASGTGTVTSGSTEIAGVTGAQFAVGQSISGAGIPAATTITAIEAEGPKLKFHISNPATASGTSIALTGSASAKVSGLAVISGAFAVGQSIIGDGIPRGAKVTEVVGSTLTLSAPAINTQASTALEGFGKCTEPEDACTVPVSEAGEALSGTLSSNFIAASADGSRAIYSTGNLTEGKADLYEFTGANEETHLIAHKVLGVLGASSDAQRVYLVSKEAIGGPNGEGKSPTAGQPNLYLREAGGGLKFVAMLSGEDARAAVGTFALTPIALEPVKHTARVAPDGMSALFMSTAKLTPYDNADAQSGKPDAEVYLYRAGQEKLLCVSCNPSGAAPSGEELTFELGAAGTWAAAQIPPPITQLYASRVLSADGNRVFFESGEPLVLSDTNGAEDVYEWEAVGAGPPTDACTESSPSYSPPNGGCLSLISSGRSTADSRFVDASEDGSDVFIATGQSLVSWDPGLIDIYDARVGGGFPPPPSPPAACQGEACQGPASAPQDQTPSSATYDGPGNATPAQKCRKGTHRAKGKCVKNKKEKKQGKKRRKSKSGRAGR